MLLLHLNILDNRGMKNRFNDLLEQNARDFYFNNSTSFNKLKRMLIEGNMNILNEKYSRS